MSSRDGDRIAFLTLPEGPLLMLWQTIDDSTYAHFTVTNGTDFPVLLYRTIRIHELHERLTKLNTPIQLYQDEDSLGYSNFMIQRGIYGALEQSLGIHYNKGNDLLDYLVDPGVFQFQDGFVNIPQGPGLGVEINEQYVRTMAKTGHNWKNPSWRPPWPSGENNKTLLFGPGRMVKT